MVTTRPDGPRPRRRPGRPPGRWRRPTGRRLLPVLALAVAVAVPAGAGVRQVSGPDGMPAGLQPVGAVADAVDAAGSGPLDDGAFDGFDDGPVDLDDFLDPDLLDAVPVGDGDVADLVEDVLGGAEVIDALDDSGIPDVARNAYDEAAAALAAEDPACRLRWPLLAAIGRVESDHGRFGGARLRSDGYGTRPIRGIPLDGRPDVALIRDTDRGLLDGDTTFDRAVGPMQFIPTTWRSVQVDADGDGRSDPDNIVDAAHGAARYLCAGTGSLDDRGSLARAVRRYNNADEYVRVVLNLATMYETGDLGTVERAISGQGWIDDEPPGVGSTPTAPPDTTWTSWSAPPGPAPIPAAAAVGWAPSMRVVVLIIIQERPTAATTTTTTTVVPSSTTTAHSDRGMTVRSDPPAGGTATACPPAAGNGGANPVEPASGGQRSRMTDSGSGDPTVACSALVSSTTTSRARS